MSTTTGLGPDTLIGLEYRSLPSQRQQYQAGSRLPALDGIRGIAILLVLFAHFSGLKENQGPWLDRAFATFINQGWVGVDLFFVLSGFLITGILLDNKHRIHYFRNFYARRTVRIFPLFYAFLFLTLFILPHLLSANVWPRINTSHAPKWLYFAYLSNFAVARSEFGHPANVSWSLAIEEQFYLVWPALVLWLRPYPLKIVCGILVFLSIVCRFILITHDSGWVPPFVLTFCRMDGLAIGAAIAIIVRELNGAQLLSRIAPWAGGVAVVALVMVYCKHMDFDRKWITVATWSYTAFALLFGGVVAMAAVLPAKALLSKTLSHPLLTTFGKYSYGLYLIHPITQQLIIKPFLRADDIGAVLGTRVPAQILYIVISTAVALGGALLSWNLFEKHFLKLKRFFETAHVPIPKVEPVPSQSTALEHQIINPVKA